MYICNDVQRRLHLKIYDMAKKTFIILLLAVLSVHVAQAQNDKMNRKEEIAQLKQAHKEAVDRVKELSAELSAQVEEMDRLLLKCKELESVKKENAELKRRISESEAAMKEVHAVQNIVPVALFFEIGKTSLGAKERVNLEFYLANAIAANPERVFTIVAIEDTSSGSNNRELADRRADHVYSLLVKKYGISPDRIINKRSVGEDLYEKSELNRVVIIK